VSAAAVPVRDIELDGRAKILTEDGQLIGACDLDALPKVGDEYEAGPTRIKVVKIDTVRWPPTIIVKLLPPQLLP
jgi:hypothetical protein